MTKDLLITFLSCLNILIFSFIGLNSQAFHQVITYQIPDSKAYFEFDQVLAQVQRDLKENQKIIPSKNLKKLPEDKATITPPQEENNNPGSQAPINGYLAVPKLNILAPLAFSQNANTVKEKLQEGVISLSDFTPPPQNGQTIVFGHSSDYSWNNNDYATVFTLLPKLENGDEIKVITETESFIYTVKKSLITGADLSGLTTALPSENQLILSTCYPIGFFSKRFNIIATPI